MDLLSSYIKVLLSILYRWHASKSLLLTPVYLSVYLYAISLLLLTIIIIFAMKWHQEIEQTKRYDLLKKIEEMSSYRSFHGSSADFQEPRSYVRKSRRISSAASVYDHDHDEFSVYDNVSRTA